MPRHAILTACLAIRAALPAGAVVTGPYAPDADTVHLWHFNETGGSIAANAVAGARPLLAFNGVAAVSGTTAQPELTTALGAPAAAGFGLAATLTAATHGLGYDANGSGGFQPGSSTTTAPPDAIAHDALTGTDGSFTLEALVSFPNLTTKREIIATDSSLTNRCFQFYTDTNGTVKFNFIGGTGATAAATIPTTGPHAFAAGEWFHVAYTYQGGSAVSTFYWTRLAATSATANALPTTGTETTVATYQGPLVVGNEGRSASGECLLGSIDEVRISRIARTAAGFLFAPDTIDLDTDGLLDSWEQLHFGHLGLTGADDPDADGFANAAEAAAGSLPNQPLSTPLDTDADGLPDLWEQTHFGSLTQGAAADPDGDGETNAAEFAGGSAPNNRASSSADTDGEGLPDAWELQHFGSIETNGGADPDGDRFSNLQEFLAATDPADAASRPAGTAVRLVPLDDQNPGTSEFGYAGASAINTVSFVRSSLTTFGNQQFVTWYGRHQFDAAAATNNTIWIGRRTLGSSVWEVFRHPTFTANTITDGHDVICFGIDGAGHLHLSWGMHGDAFHYARSTTPVTGSGPITLGPDTTMTGREATVTYPQFLRLPDGDLLFLFREGSSGSGDTYLNRYDTATATWDNVHRSGSTQLPFIKGRGWTPDYNAYPNMPQLDAAGALQLTWCWRYNSDSPAGETGYQTNNQFAFARSADGGLTWNRADGTAYTLPISRSGESGDPATAAGHILAIPEGSSLINQAGMCLDRAGQPVIGSWWAPETAAGNFRRQYMVAFRHDHGTPSTADDTWETRAVSNRTSNPTTTKYSETYVRDLGRPIVVCDDDDRIIMAYRDDEGSNGITIVHSLPKAADPDRLVWITFDLTTANLGNYEPTIDHELWERERQLHFLYQASQGEGYTPPANTADRIAVLEWDAAAYFSHRPQPTVAFAPNGTDATITVPSEPSWRYRLWSSTDLLDWQVLDTRQGTGAPLVFDHPNGAASPRRFWRCELSPTPFP